METPGIFWEDQTEDIPANQAIRKYRYFKPTNTKKYPGNKPTNLPIANKNELHSIIPHSSLTDHSYGKFIKFKTPHDLDILREKASDRNTWI